MREIKFRFWEVPSSKFHYDIDALSKNPSVLISEIFECRDSLIFAQQSLNLGDKTATEMYEGDIVKYEILNHQLQPVSWICEIRWNHWCWALFKNGGYFLPIDSGTRANCRVIGNIYENPELLRGEE